MKTNNPVPSHTFNDNDYVADIVAEFLLEFTKRKHPGATFKRLPRNNKLDIQFYDREGNSLFLVEVKNRSYSEKFFQSKGPLTETLKVDYAKTKKEPVYLAVVTNDGILLIFDMKKPSRNIKESKAVWSSKRYDNVRDVVKKNRPETQDQSVWDYEKLLRRFEFSF